MKKLLCLLSALCATFFLSSCALLESVIPLNPWASSSSQNETTASSEESLESEVPKESSSVEQSSSEESSIEESSSEESSSKESSSEENSSEESSSEESSSEESSSENSSTSEEPEEVITYTHTDFTEWEKKAQDLAGRFIKNFVKYTGNEAGKALVAAGPQL